VGRDSRPKKTQEELDAEMADYFGGAKAGAAHGDAQAAGDDVDMIE
jgi:THO complex subunit 4